MFENKKRYLNTQNITFWNNKKKKFTGVGVSLDLFIWMLSQCMFNKTVHFFLFYFYYYYHDNGVFFPCTVKDKPLTQKTTFSSFIHYLIISLFLYVCVFFVALIFSYIRDISIHWRWNTLEARQLKICWENEEKILYS